MYMCVHAACANPRSQLLRAGRKAWIKIGFRLVWHTKNVLRKNGKILPPSNTLMHVSHLRNGNNNTESVLTFSEAEMRLQQVPTHSNLSVNICSTSKDI